MADYIDDIVKDEDVKKTEKENKEKENVAKDNSNQTPDKKDKNFTKIAIMVGGGIFAVVFLISALKIIVPFVLGGSGNQQKQTVQTKNTQPSNVLALDSGSKASNPNFDIEKLKKDIIDEVKMQIEINSDSSDLKNQVSDLSNQLKEFMNTIDAKFKEIDDKINHTSENLLAVSSELDKMKSNMMHLKKEILELRLLLNLKRKQAKVNTSAKSNIPNRSSKLAVKTTTQGRKYSNNYVLTTNDGGSLYIKGKKIYDLTDRYLKVSKIIYNPDHKIVGFGIKGKTFYEGDLIDGYKIYFVGDILYLVKGNKITKIKVSEGA